MHELPAQLRPGCRRRPRQHFQNLPLPESFVRAHVTLCVIIHLLHNNTLWTRCVNSADQEIAEAGVSGIHELAPGCMGKNAEIFRRRGYNPRRNAVASGDDWHARRNLREALDEAFGIAVFFRAWF